MLSQKHHIHMGPVRSGSGVNEVWKKLERKEEHFAFIDYYFLLLLIS